MLSGSWSLPTTTGSKQGVDGRVEVGVGAEGALDDRDEGGGGVRQVAALMASRKVLHHHKHALDDDDRDEMEPGGGVRSAGLYLYSGGAQ